MYIISIFSNFQNNFHFILVQGSSLQLLICNLNKYLCAALRPFFAAFGARPPPLNPAFLPYALFALSQFFLDENLARLCEDRHSVRVCRSEAKQSKAKQRLEDSRPENKAKSIYDTKHYGDATYTARSPLFLYVPM
jgi:hypothetical protein